MESHGLGCHKVASRFGGRKYRPPTWWDKHQSHCKKSTGDGTCSHGRLWGKRATTCGLPAPEQAGAHFPRPHCLSDCLSCLFLTCSLSGHFRASCCPTPSPLCSRGSSHSPVWFQATLDTSFIHSGFEAGSPVTVHCMGY